MHIHTQTDTLYKNERHNLKSWWNKHHDDSFEKEKDFLRQTSSSPQFVSNFVKKKKVLALKYVCLRDCRLSSSSLSLVKHAHWSWSIKLDLCQIIFFTCSQSYSSHWAFGSPSMVTTNFIDWLRLQPSKIQEYAVFHLYFFLFMQRVSLWII